MATNKYFTSTVYDSGRNQQFIERSVIHYIQTAGLDFIYIPRVYVNEDDLLGEEAAASIFKNYYTIEMYVKNIDGWGGENEFLSQWGVEVRDQVSLSLSIKRFNDEVTAIDEKIQRPREGDLITIPLTFGYPNRLFEIKFVEDEETFFQFGRSYTYEVRCEVFEYAGEHFNTGQQNIDSYNNYGADTLLVMSDGEANFHVSEIIMDENNPSFNGIVTEWNADTNELTIENTSLQEIQLGDTLYGTKSDARRTVVQMDDVKLSSNDNERLKQEDDSVVMYDESNPFDDVFR